MRMRMTGFRFSPLDTLFFRDGTPFFAESAPQDGVGSLFPPSPRSMGGAVRAALALSSGWNGRAGWPDRISEVLGDGPEDLGRIALAGPFPVCGEQPLFRAPRHLLGLKVKDGARWTPRLYLRPGPETECDLGSARLPEPVSADARIHEVKAGGDHWLTPAGMDAVLQGALPPEAEIVADEELWNEEPRIGLERNPTTRTAEEGMLYSTRHVRLRCDVSLGVHVAGVPEHWAKPFGRMVPLGGESRLAECLKLDPELSWSIPWKTVESEKRIALVALTPTDLDEAMLGGEPLNIPGAARIVSACLDRPQRIGGWNSLDRTPLPLRSMVAPGGVFFCELGEPEDFRAAAKTCGGLLHIGHERRWGYGLVAPGVWPSEVTS